MAEPDLVLRVLYGFAVVALLLATSAFLLFVPPVSLPKRLLALFLGLSAFREVAILDILGRPYPPGFLGVWMLYQVDLQVLSYLALLAFFWVYPSRVRLRSWHGAAFLAAMALVLSGGVLWHLARDLMILPDGAPFWGTGRMLLHRLTFTEGTWVALLVGAASAVLRARVLPADRARSTYLLAPALVAPAFTTAAGIPAWLALNAAFGTTFWPTALQGVPGDCCAIIPATWLLQHALAFGLAGFLLLRLRSRFAAALLLIALTANALTAVIPVDIFTYAFLFTAIAPLYVISRDGAFDTTPGARRVDFLLAGVAMVSVFLAVTALVVISFGETLFVVALGIFIGLAAGVAAAAAVLPVGRNLILGDLGDLQAMDRRLGAYRAALQHEIESGLDSAAIASRLKGLRAQLGVSEIEHGIMEYTLRGARDPHGTPWRLAPDELFLNRYRVRRVLGEGGSGITYLCRDERVGRDVVLKRLRSADPTAEDLGAVLREARAISAVAHPNVVTLHDVEQVGDEALIVMEHLPGGSLAARLADGPWPRGAFLPLAEDLLAALEAIHAAGIVHRDVKPANVLLTDRGRAKLADFGVAHLPSFDTTVGATGGAARGTVAYMSPEQARGLPLDARSDLYSAAATLYEAWVGRPYVRPRQGESPMAMQIRVSAGSRFRRPGGVEGDPALWAWFQRALHPDPAERFASAVDMRAALLVALGDGAGRRAGAPAGTGEENP